MGERVENRQARVLFARGRFHRISTRDAEISLSRDSGEVQRPRPTILYVRKPPQRSRRRHKKISPAREFVMLSRKSNYPASQNCTSRCGVIVEPVVHLLPLPGNSIIYSRKTLFYIRPVNVSHTFPALSVHLARSPLPLLPSRAIFLLNGCKIDRAGIPRRRGKYCFPARFKRSSLPPRPLPPGFHDTIEKRQRRNAGGRKSLLPSPIPQESRFSSPRRQEYRSANGVEIVQGYIAFEEETEIQLFVAIADWERHGDDSGSKEDHGKLIFSPVLFPLPLLVSPPWLAFFSPRFSIFGQRARKYRYYWLIRLAAKTIYTHSRARDGDAPARLSEESDTVSRYRAT